jgi:hypothetical protein
VQQLSLFPQNISKAFETETFFQGYKWYKICFSAALPFAVQKIIL